MEIAEGDGIEIVFVDSKNNEVARLDKETSKILIETSVSSFISRALYSLANEEKTQIREEVKPYDAYEYEQQELPFDGTFSI